MAVNLSPVGGAAAQFFDNDGNVLSGGKIYTYLAGTSTSSATYTTSAGSIAHANPIILDSAGRVPGGEIWLTVGVTYKFTIKNSSDTLIGTYDNIPGQFNTNASLVTYTPAGTGAVTTTVQAKLRQTVSVQDFGAVGNGVADDTAAFQAAHNASVANGFNQVNIPQGIYLISSTLEWSPFVEIKCTGNVLINTPIASGYLFHISAQYGQPAIVSATSGAFDSYNLMFDGGMMINATNATNTATCFYLGNTTSTSGVPTRFLRIQGVSTCNFAGAIQFGNNAYLINFNGCSFLGSYDATRKLSTNGIKQPSGVVILDSGENIVFDHCTFQHFNNATINQNNSGSNSLSIKFNDCSFDQCLQVVGQDNSNCWLTFLDCHIEYPGTSTAFYPNGGDVINIIGGVFFCPVGSYANPLFANCGGNSRLSISKMQHSLASSTAVFITADTNVLTFIEDKPIYQNGSVPPTLYINPQTPANNYVNTTSENVSFTPEWTTLGTQPVLGNGTLVGQYTRIGKSVNVKIKLTIGSTTTLGTGGWGFGLPFTTDASGFNSLGQTYINLFGVRQEFGLARIAGPVGTIVSVFGNPSNAQEYTATYPAAWPVGSTLELDITYIKV
jgi:hypothetical protein